MRKNLILEWAEILIDLAWEVPPENFINEWIWNLATKGKSVTMPKIGVRVPHF